METAGSIDEVLEGRVLVAEGAPLYFDWAPPGDAVVVHTRGRVFVTEPDGDRRAELSGNPGTFRAPAARGDGRGVTLVLDSAGDHRIATVDLTGREIRHSAAPAGAALAWGPGGEYLATLRYGPAGPIGVLDIVDTRSTVRNISMVPVQTRTPGRQTALAMEWSTTEAAMLVLRRNRESESTNPELPLRWEWIRLDGERPRQDIIVAFRPTPDFIQGRLPFFDQYARFLSRIAPDTRAVTYSRLAADGPVVEVFEFESKQTVRIGRGVHPTWRPVDPNGR
jgi:hypothetical protein